jgi:hypothetical protein
MENLKRMATEYEYDLKKIEQYLTVLEVCPCVIKGTEEEKMECLETLVSDRSSEELIREISKEDYVPKSFEYSFSDALYRVYQESAMPYLAKEYLEIKFNGNHKKRCKR